MRKAAPARDVPPPLELECLQALWSLGEGQVKDVREGLARRRNLAYTTVMTMLERLTLKGCVSRRKVGRSFVYAPAITQESVRKLAVQELVERFFNGSEEALGAYLSHGEHVHSAPRRITMADVFVDSAAH
jgi:predicted transcriptional regulator